MPGIKVELENGQTVVVARSPISAFTRLLDSYNWVVFSPMEENANTLYIRSSRIAGLWEVDDEPLYYLLVEDSGDGT